MENKKQKIDELLSRGVAKIYPSKNALAKTLNSGRQLRVYQGFDPSMPNLHLGNTVGILKLKQFQELGHKVIFLVGDFTGMIGDPTDKSSARPRLTRDQVLQNAKNWKTQALRFLKFGGKNPADLRFNSSWLDKITFRDLIEITANFTVGQMLERDFFQKRMSEGKPIFLHEFLYPTAQALDSVALEVDLEVGGSDQTFNMLAGRDLMEAMKGKEKFVLAMNLLTDKEGRKVGKTAGNALFLNSLPKDMYGGIMSFPDGTIIPAFELLTALPEKEIEEYKKEMERKSLNPMEMKKSLAFEITKLNFGKEKAKEAQKEFEKVFQKREIPSVIKEFAPSKKRLSLLELLAETGGTASKSEAKRLIMQNAVKINKKTENDWQKTIEAKKGTIIQIGRKRFFKVK